MKMLTVGIMAGVLATAAGCGKNRSDAPDGAPVSRATHLTAERARNAGVETAIAGEARIRTTLTLHGPIRPHAEREQEIRARYPGVVRDVRKRVGDPVAA